jgi:hypothetical protein
MCDIVHTSHLSADTLMDRLLKAGRMERELDIVLDLDACTDRFILLKILQVLLRIEQELRPKVVLTPGKPSVTIKR